MTTLDSDSPLAIALATAIQTGDVEQLKRLLTGNAELAKARIVDAKSTRRTLLHVAADWPGHFPNGARIVATLIEAGAEPNAAVELIEPTHAETALHWAASSNDVVVLDALLDGGADIEAPGAVFTGGTAMSDAVVFANWDAARRLLERGACTTFWQAAALGLLDQVRDYFDGAPRSAHDITSSFWHACRGGQAETARFLLSHGADLNWVGWDRKTPLNCAVESGNQELISLDALERREVNSLPWYHMRIVAIAVLVAFPLAAQLKQFKPGFNLFSQQQDIQMGQEAAAEVEKTMQVVHNPELTDYISRVGARLAKSKHAGTFPFKFQVVNDPSINAFALPGGPMFVHTGLIEAVDNEGELAGVLAHEMSHVALRHGTHQASKANLIQLPAMLAGGILGQGSMWGQLSQLGINLGSQSVLLKYSRDAEREADLNGAQIMNDAGYDPEQMARLFTMLEELGQKDNSKLANFLSDHPSPGNRVEYVRDQNKFLPKVQYSELEPDTLTRSKQIVAGLPPPPPPKTAASGNNVAAAASPRPSGKYKQFQGRAFGFVYPDNWETFGEQDAAMVTVAPRSGLVQDSRGQTSIAYGMIASYWIPDSSYVDISRETEVLVAQLQKQSPGLERTRDPQDYVTVAGQRAMLTPMQSASPFQGQTEVDVLLTVPRPEGLFYLMFVSPRNEWDAAAGKEFDNVLNSINFPN